MLKMRVESPDDLWLLYTLLKEGDKVTARTMRDVKQGEGEKGRRLPMILTISLKHMEFQPFTNRLRMRGIVIEGPDTFGILGSHHTLSVGVGDELLVEREEGWSARDVKRLEESSMKLGSVIIVAVDYDEVAVGVFRRQGLKRVLERDLRLPGKGDERREAELSESVEDIAKEVAGISEREGDVVGIVVAGPGFLKEKVREELQRILKDKPVLIENASMGGYAGIREAVARGKPAELLRSQELHDVEESFERILRQLGEDPQLVGMGKEECGEASKVGAVDVCLVLDELLSSASSQERLEIEGILNSIQSFGGKIHVVPWSTPLGERLYSLGGMVCLLRFPLFRERSR